MNDPQARMNVASVSDAPCPLYNTCVVVRIVVIEVAGRRELWPDMVTGFGTGEVLLDDCML